MVVVAVGDTAAPTLTLGWLWFRTRRHRISAFTTRTRTTISRKGPSRGLLLFLQTILCRNFIGQDL